MRADAHWDEIAAGQTMTQAGVRIIPAASVKSFSPKGFLLLNGEEFAADVVVFCAAFDRIGSRAAAASIFVEDVASRLEDFRSLNAEREVNGAW